MDIDITSGFRKGKMRIIEEDDRERLRVVAAIFALITLISCASAPEPKVVTEIVERRVEVPRSLLSCSLEPVAWVSQRDVARHMVYLAEAGEACRTKLDAVRRLVEAVD